MSDPNDGDQWEYKRLDVNDGLLLEDGEQLPTRTLKLRSLELIQDGWEPIAASEVHRRYRRARPEADQPHPASAGTSRIRQ